MNLGTLKTETARLAGRVDGNWSSRIRRFLNEAQRDWASKIPWPTLIKFEDFSSLGTRTMVLPQHVLFVRHAADKTNQRPLYYSEQWDREYPASYFGGASGSPLFTRERGVTAITKQPTTEETYTIKTSQSDVCNVYIGGLVQDTTASGTPDFQYFDKESISVVDDSEVAGTKSFVRVDVIGKDDFTSADIVVRDTSSNVVARIPALEYTAEYRQIELMHIPVAGTVIQVEYINKPAPLIEDYQVPHPSIKPEFLIWHAAALMHFAQGQVDEGTVKMQRATEWLQQEIYKERGFGDRDWRMLPDISYYNDEDQYDSNEDY
jgi:hypothetical protein